MRQHVTMSILDYFKMKNALPNPTGPLSTVVTPLAIAASSKEVKALLSGESGSIK